MSGDLVSISCSAVELVARNLAECFGLVVSFSIKEGGGLVLGGLVVSCLVVAGSCWPLMALAGSCWQLLVLLVVPNYFF